MATKIVVTIAFLSVALIATGAEVNEKSNFCRSVKSFINNPHKTNYRYSYISTLPTDAQEAIPGVDLDSDGLVDSLKLVCSASIIPADPCALEVETASGVRYEKYLQFGELAFFFKSKKVVYLAAVSKSRAGTKKSRVFEVRAKDTKLMCSF